MKKLIYPCLLVHLLVSCKTQNSSESIVGNDTIVYQLRLNPATGAQYHYDITNESNIEMEVAEKEVNNSSTSKVGINYNVDKDSLGNFLLHITYDKIYLHTKAGEKESEMDASFASNSLDPVEKLLGVLKNARLTAVITPSGQVKDVIGYKELGEQLTAGFGDHDEHSKAIALQQWEQTAGQGLIKKNLDQLFTIFPDSAVHRGDRWKIISKGNNEFGLTSNTFYQLKAINEDIALIESRAEMQSDSSISTISGYNALANLKGEQQGRFEMETKTGMLISCTITSKMQGSVQVMGREVPITVKTEINMKGKKVK